MEPLEEAIALIQDAKGIVGWARGRAFAEGHAYWLQRMDAWTDAAHNDTLARLRAREAIHQTATALDLNAGEHH